MRWCAALALVLVALVVVTVRALRRPPKRPPPTDVEIAAIDPPEATAPRATSSAPVRRESEAVAHLRGRVLYPTGPEPTDDLEVVAEDLTRRVTARIGEHGQFDIHLPSGRYTLVASAGALVGVVPDVLVGPGAARDVDIRLATGATIRGKVRLPDDVLSMIEIVAVPTGRDDPSGEPEVDDGQFSIGGLIVGRRYDITFRGPAFRSAKLIGISAPADGLEVELQGRAEVRGVSGLVGDGECPIANVALQVAGKTIVDEDEEEVSADVEDDCSFKLAVPDRVAAVTVVATGDGWHLEEQVTIPPSGDPAPICFNPPCRNEPQQQLGRLELTIDGDSAPTEFTATLSPASRVPSRTRLHSCSSSGNSCAMKGFKAGATFLITAHGSTCRAPRREVTVMPGNNLVRLPCIRQREIEGVVRIPRGEGPVSVRCPGGDEQPLAATRLFLLTCRADATAVEYQIGEEGMWRSVPVASASAEDPAFVEIRPL